MMQQQYLYAAQPHAAPMKTKPKYRDPNEEISRTIADDSRVTKGWTGISNKKGQKTVSYSKTLPGPSGNSDRRVVQTADILEELTDRPVEQDEEMQTQPFLDRPASPIFVRAKIGYDVATQIDRSDLYDFDLEVEPILEVLVGKTLHVAMLEIAQEDELEAIILQREQFEMIRNVELAEVQRLEAEIKRKAMEKERRISQEKKRLEDHKHLEEAIFARVFSNQFLNELHTHVFDMLESQGEFYDPVERELTQFLLPSLSEGVIRKADIYDVAHQMLSELLDNADLTAQKFETEAIKRREDLKEKMRKEEEERKRKEEEERLAELARKKAVEEAEENPPEE